MSAWSEAIYIINKLNYSLDAMFDIDQNGIQNINTLNNQIDFLRRKVGYREPEHPEQIIDNDNLLERQNTVQNLLEDIQGLINSIMGEGGIYETITQQLNQFETELNATAKIQVAVASLAALRNYSNANLISNYGVGLVIE